jgi:hypothetical protein
MKRASPFACVSAIFMTFVFPMTSYASDLPLPPNLQAPFTTSHVPNAWLNQFGMRSRAEPLCNTAPNSNLQILSPDTCAALSIFQAEPAVPKVRTVNIRQIKRNRAIWNAIPRHEQRILEQYEVVVVGQARGVDTKISGPR